MSERTRLGCLGFIAGLIALVSLPGSAAAHAKYERSSPADESTVAGPPSEVWAEYSEPPTQDSWLQVYDPCGQRVDSGTYSYLAKRITTSISADKAGIYTVLWRVVSDLDSHPTSGEFTFTVTDGAPCPGSGGDGNDGEGNDGDGKRRSSGDEKEPDTAPEQTDGSVNATGSSGEGDTATAQGSSGDGAKDRKKGHKQHKRMTEEQGDTEQQPVELVAETAPDPEPQGIPTDWLLISFGIAALIGAAGGQIYVSIVDGD